MIRYLLLFGLEIEHLEIGTRLGNQPGGSDFPKVDSSQDHNFGFVLGSSI